MKSNEKRKKYAEKFSRYYRHPRWRALKTLRFSYANGLCERCYARGIIQEAEELHHIIPVEECEKINPELIYDFDNVIYLCKACHNEIHDRVSPLTAFLNIYETLEVQNGRKKSDD